MMHLRTVCLSITLAMISNVAFAADSSDDSASVAKNPQIEKVGKKSKKGYESTARNSSTLAGQTDIVAKVDLPMVVNVMPWKDAGSPPLKFSTLKESLISTDRVRIENETRYSSILDQPLEQK